MLRFARAWKVASELLATLTKLGIDPLRATSVREALKRLVKDALDGLASRYPTSVKVSASSMSVCRVSQRFVEGYCMLVRNTIQYQ